MSTDWLPLDWTIYETDRADLAAPPAEANAPEDRPTFIPYDVAPKLLNADEVRKKLSASYPVTLREAKIEGRVILWIFIDKQGNVLKSQVQVTSGYAKMDQVALDVANAMRFQPAKNRDKTTPVWVQQAIDFEVH